MTVAFEELQVLQAAEAVADTIWRTVQRSSVITSANSAR